MAILEAILAAAAAANNYLLKPYKQVATVEFETTYNLSVTQQTSNVFTSWWTFTIAIDGVEVFQELVHLGRLPFEKDAVFRGHPFRVRIDFQDLPRDPHGKEARVAACIVQLLQGDKVLAVIDTGF